MMIVWILPGTVYAIHKRQIAEHGGTDGVRDDGLLQSALARPKNLAAYTNDVDLAGLAASYAFGIAKNHPFLDGNKRTALVVAETFLMLNGHDVYADASETYMQFLGLADGTVSEEELAKWIRQHLAELR